ncbi:MAG: hypothetical protein SGBAC_002970, partial [Bacillariaceae sp.]
PAASEEMDGFGSFESTNPATETVTDQDTDDFGSFESTAPVTEPAASEEMDGFGGFESTNPATETATDQDADDFGTLESTGPATEPAASEEMDGFGSFESTTPTIETAAHQDVDDFGTFESTGPGAEEAIGQEEDDFGNFDSAPAASTLPPKTTDSHDEMNGGSDSADDEFGDFGDFDEAPPAPSKSHPETPDGSEGMNGGTSSTDDEFGDFGDFDEAPSQPSQSQAVLSAESSGVNNDAQPAPATSSMLTKVFDMDRVRPIFTSLQSKYPFEQISADGGDSSLFGTNSLESYLKSAQARMNGKENDSAKLSLSKDFFGDVIEESPSKIVIENDGRGPYYSFMAPVGGILQYSKNIDVILRDKKAAPIVSKSEPTRAPSTSARSKSAPQASNSKAAAIVDGTQSETPAARTATRVAIPPKEDVSKPKSAGDLASRIPDLSFMMQSKLTLPKQ